jgi:transcriptional regulator with XRE-family HTH domain
MHAHRLCAVTWWKYVQDTAGPANPSDISRRVGISQSAVTRWQISSPKPETVAAFARAYERPVLEAFVAAGFLTDEEAGITRLDADLSQVDLEELLFEAWRRVKG